METKPVKRGVRPRAAAGARSHLRLGDRPRSARWCWSALITGAGCSGLGIGFVLTMILFVGDLLPAFQGRRHLGHRRAGDVGLRDRQLRLVDRDRPRGNVDLGDPLAVATGMADLDQPVRRGDDPVRRRLRRAVPAASHGPPLGLLLATPYPNTMALWPQWRSPLVWDVFAVSTYATVSLLFWYVGLIPDLATLRDRAKNGSRGSSMGSWRWAGVARRGTGIAIGPPICCSPGWPRRWSSRSTRVVSLDFAVGIVPGLALDDLSALLRRRCDLLGLRDGVDARHPAPRAAFGLHDFITTQHLDNMAKVMLATGLIVGYGYLMEAFMAWYSQNPLRAYSTS